MTSFDMLEFDMNFLKSQRDFTFLQLWNEAFYMNRLHGYWRRLADDGDKVQAIRVVKAMYECGLKDAKERVEAYLSTIPRWDEPRWPGCWNEKHGFAGRIRDVDVWHYSYELWDEVVERVLFVTADDVGTDVSAVGVKLPHYVELHYNGHLLAYTKGLTDKQPERA